MNPAKLIFLWWLTAVLCADSLAAESFPHIELGNPETILTNGQFGLHYFPDERVSFAKSDFGLTVFLATEVRSVVLHGRTMLSLGAPRDILLPGKAGEFDNGYAGISGSWRSPAGEIIALYHAEDHEGLKQLPNGVNGFYARVALAVSADNGLTFAKRGPILSGHLKKNSSGLSDQGVGEPWLIANPAGDFLHAYYTSHERVEERGVQICLARCPVTDALNPGGWKKYHAGQFKEPGLGGSDTPVLTSGRPDANAIFPHVTWLASQRRFVMFYCVNAWAEQAAPRVSGIYAAFSDDGIHWPDESRRQIWAALVTPVVGQPLAWHPSLVLEESKSPNEIKGWLYYGGSEKWGHQPPLVPHYLMRRSVILRWE